MSDIYYESDKFKDKYRKDVEKSKTVAEAGWASDRTTHSYMRYVCNRCRLIQFHPLTYCPLCGQKFDRLKLSHADIMDNYADYKQGY